MSATATSQPVVHDQMVFCPSCGKPFQRVAGPVQVLKSSEPNPDNTPIVRLVCICKVRSCKHPFTVRLRVLI